MTKREPEVTAAFRALWPEKMNLTNAVATVTRTAYRRGFRAGLRKALTLTAVVSADMGRSLIARELAPPKRKSR